MTTDTHPVWAHLRATPPPTLDRRVTLPPRIPREQGDPRVGLAIALAVVVPWFCGLYQILRWIFG